MRRCTSTFAGSKHLSRRELFERRLKGGDKNWREGGPEGGREGQVFIGARAHVQRKVLFRLQEIGHCFIQNS
jgi:hypothetical protein